MNIQFTNLDSTGTPATKQLRFEFEGEYYEIEPNDQGVADVPESVGKHLAESNRSSITLPDQAGPDQPGQPGDPGQPDGSREVEEAAREVIETMERDGDDASLDESG